MTIPVSSLYSEKEKLEGMLLAIMDMQPSLLKSMSNAEGLVESNKILACASDLLQIPYAFTEQAPDKLGSTTSSLQPFLNKGKVISKNSFSAFGSQEFSELIDDKGCKHLLLSGVETSICIYLTALDALDRNLNVSVLVDCVGCRRLEDGRFALENLHSLGVRLIAMETFLFSVLGSSTHARFRDISGMIRQRGRSESSD